MPVTLVNPPGLARNETHHHVSIATGSRQVHVSGQVAIDENGNLVGKGDLAAQVEQAFRNVATALKSTNATFADVVRLNIYVTGWTSQRMAEFAEGLGRVAAELQIGKPPTSLIGVDKLFVPDYLVEIEATAVLD